MGLYEVPGFTGWAIGLFVLFALMAFNEFGREQRNGGGLVLFLVVPIILTVLLSGRKQPHRETNTVRVPGLTG